MANKKGVATAIVGLVSGFWMLACAGEAPGERATTGACPEGEVCSDATPDGLVFVGEALFDDGSTTRLGPIAKGGRFDLGVRSVDGLELPPMEFRFEDGTVLDVTEGTGTFNDGNSAIEVQDYISIRGLQPGTTYVRVVDPSTGELYDRLALEVTEIGEVRLTNAHNPDQPFRPGQEEALGVQLIGDDGAETRAFDLDMKVTSVEADMGADPGMWDCFLFTPPTTVADAMDFEVTVGDKVSTGSMPVAPADEI